MRVYFGAALLAVALVGPVAKTEAGFIAVGTPLDNSAPTISLATNSDYSGANFGAARVARKLSLTDGRDLVVAPDPMQSNIEPSVSVNFSPVGIMVANAAVGIVPEPGSIVLFGLGAIGVLVAARRRRKRVN